MIPEAEFFLELEGEGLLSPKISFGGETYGVADFKKMMPRLFEQAVQRVDPKWQEMPLQLLEGPQLQTFLEELEKNPKAPPLVWKNRPQKLMPDPLPILRLKDLTGAFADLWMDYGPFGHQEAAHPVLPPSEKEWESDLLEAGFIKKTVGEARYYCPLDRVGAALILLLGVGWTIVNPDGKKVVLATFHALTAEPKEEGWSVQGEITYGERRSSLSQAMAAFKERRRFIDLDTGSVGLLELPPGWSDLADEEATPHGLRVRHHHLGLLEQVAQLPATYTPATWEVTPPSHHFCGQLYPYQQQGVNWLSFLWRSHFHGLLADEMGLGKTVQILAFLSRLEPSHPILIVMPHSLLFNWNNELKRFLPSQPVYIHSGPERSSKLPSSGVILTSYAVLRHDHELFAQEKFEVVILDEAQMIKNSTSLTSQIVKRLQSRFRLAVTGTPIENRIDDLISIFEFLMPDLSLTTHIAQKIRPFTLRRLKTSVDLQLPSKTEQLVWADFSEEQQTFYHQFLLEKKTAMRKNQFQVLELILRLRQICCHPLLIGSPAPSAKFERLLADLEEILPAGHKVLIYSQFTQMLGLMRSEFHQRGWNTLYLDGTTHNREQVVEQFQTDPSQQLFLISLKAGGVGLNLTAADYVFLYDPWWNEAAENQAIDRAHRVGRKHSVICRRYIAAGTIEEKVVSLKEHKKSLAQQVLDFDTEAGPLTLDELYALLE
jgi:superfamily II DNA or RNA helicase